MSALWWWIVTFEFDDHRVDMRVTVAATCEGEAGVAAEMVLYEMGFRGGSYRYLVEHLACVVPAGVVTYRARLTGEGRAACDGCGYVWGYWDCPCELVHTCEPV